ncbi:hypothetical protein B6N60_03896 [Richelia sinica FACHB-800]|uniref:Uncharacterized protein n=1 Tax=Richelia sinica FACHB-800 TaxID=1357546 RepID=A0A975Y6E9_9NOST|nr:hypothetical protein B6N60_03896 [Richelia sinica FACHB-800]
MNNQPYNRGSGR